MGKLESGTMSPPQDQDSSNFASPKPGPTPPPTPNFASALSSNQRGDYPSNFENSHGGEKIRLNKNNKEDESNGQSNGEDEKKEHDSSVGLKHERNKERKPRVSFQQALRNKPWLMRALRSKIGFNEDYRGRLPEWCSRFTGYRPVSDQKPPYEPLPFPPFSWLSHVPLRLEVWIFGWIGAFGSILLIEAIMSTSTAFRDIYHAPTIITSFGASAVLLFGVIESPLAQPRNFVLGHFFSALIGTAITRLFVLNGSYDGYLDNKDFHPSPFINGGLSMATSLLAQLVLGCLHPPAGATALNAAVQLNVVQLSWRYLPTILASSLIMLGWALFINNLGRRRYPIYWWSPKAVFVRLTLDESEETEETEEAEETDANPEGQDGHFERRLSSEDIERGRRRASRSMERRASIFRAQEAARERKRALSISDNPMRRAEEGEAGSPGIRIERLYSEGGEDDQDEN
ncbi:hypothetical protein L228DRAFT_283202 [Xylona heveae TC161]|uniref:HPP transmembrane region domain-containing protein n=1 Tax=Xylona heveae (strain CBS 132557 / TC161) TaxID=1328760 RepID=A0A165GBZ9_XYLHT|nr:hypothetical protein L228DRAFT_283202 [Xylona heveae TC161]KZF22005.1 hypothetical protein L228DRAFT_283202 [Xylona heveae TC161]